MVPSCVDGEYGKRNVPLSGVGGVHGQQRTGAEQERCQGRNRVLSVRRSIKRGEKKVGVSEEGVSVSRGGAALGKIVGGGETPDASVEGKNRSCPLRRRDG
jgi:hypothetical protein